jgi:predicted  nucleic acid-binding Zn-ribbon protein
LPHFPEHSQLQTAEQQAALTEAITTREQLRLRAEEAETRVVQLEEHVSTLEADLNKVQTLNERIVELEGFLQAKAEEVEEVCLISRISGFDETLTCPPIDGRQVLARLER